MAVATLICRRFPRASRGYRGEASKHLYAVGYVDGLVKIGITEGPRERLCVHERKGGMEWVHLGPGMRRSKSRGIEAIALRAADAAGERIALTESFRGISKTQAIACMRHAHAVYLDRVASEE